MKKRNFKKIKIAAAVLSIAGGAVAAYKVYSRKKKKIKEVAFSQL